MNRLRILLALVIGLAFAAIPTLSAQAAPSAPTSASQPQKIAYTSGHKLSKHARNCITRPVAAGEQQFISCYSTRQQARTAAATRYSASSDSKMAVLYSNAWLGGDTLTIYQNPNLGWCNGWGNIPSYFNDRTSSLRNYCSGMRLYVNSNRGGSSEYYGNGSWNVSNWMNDRASSYSF